MKRIVISALCALALTAALPARAFAQELVLGGRPLGIELLTEGVTVAGFSEVDTEEGPASPAREAGLLEGDRIVWLGGRRIGGAQELIDAVERLQGAEAELSFLRAGESRTVLIRPARTRDGQWMLGLWLRDQSAGIGTLTFYDPETGVFGALGHGVSDETTGETLPIRGGRITDAQIVDVHPGSKGEPGELSGCADRGCVLGEVTLNSERGVFGRALAALGGAVAETGEAAPGPASILTTLEGREAQAFSVEIARVYTEGGAERLLLTVTDPALQQAAGGIVQGMSGSPILQEGRLVGAVTHVLVSDPCRGYGIGIRDMLAEAGIEREERAA